MKTDGHASTAQQLLVTARGHDTDWDECDMDTAFLTLFKTKFNWELEERMRI